MSKVYVGDVGTEIVLGFGVDVSTATVLKIRAKKSDSAGTVIEWDGTLEGTDSVKYIIQAGDLDVAGSWKLQAYVEIASWSGLSETATLKVYEPYT